MHLHSNYQSPPMLEVISVMEQLIRISSTNSCNEFYTLPLSLSHSKICQCLSKDMDAFAVQTVFSNVTSITSSDSKTFRTRYFINAILYFSGHSMSLPLFFIKFDIEVSSSICPCAQHPDLPNHFGNPTSHHLLEVWPNENCPFRYKRSAKCILAWSLW